MSFLLALMAEAQSQLLVVYNVTARICVVDPQYVDTMRIILNE